MTDPDDQDSSVGALISDRFNDDDDTQDAGNSSNQEDTDNTGDAETTGDTGNTGDSGNTGNRQDVKNYPFYIPADLREELDTLYNQYDGKNKVEGGEGIEKHREFLEPIMRSALEELELDEVVPYEQDDE